MNNIFAKYNYAFGYIKGVISLFLIFGPIFVILGIVVFINPSPFLKYLDGLDSISAALTLIVGGLF